MNNLTSLFIFETQILGGFSYVYRGVDTSSNELVAIKVSTRDFKQC